MSKTKSRGLRPAPLDGDNLYAAEAILDKKVNALGKTIYLIKWVGWGHSSNTWEPEENIINESLLKEFEERQMRGQLNKNNKRTPSSQYNMSQKLLKCDESRPKRPKKRTSSDSDDNSCDRVLQSRSNSTSRRSSVSSRRNSTTFAVNEHLIDPNAMRGMPEPYGARGKVSSESEQTINTFVDKNNYSDFESFYSSASNSSYSKVNDFNNKTVNSYLMSENRLDFEPQVVLERLPTKLVFKRLLSNDHRNTYQISMSAIDNDNQNTSIESNNENLLDVKSIGCVVEDNNVINNDNNICMDLTSDKIVVSDKSVDNSDQRHHTFHRDVNSGESHVRVGNSIADTGAQESEITQMSSNYDLKQQKSHPIDAQTSDHTLSHTESNHSPKPVPQSAETPLVLNGSTVSIQSIEKPLSAVDSLVPEMMGKVTDEPIPHFVPHSQNLINSDSLIDNILSDRHSSVTNRPLPQAVGAESGEPNTTSDNVQNGSNGGTTGITTAANDELLDLTFNDDLMLDNVVEQTHAVNPVVAYKTDPKKADAMTDHLIESQYSPVSEEERDWSPVESESSTQDSIDSPKGSESTDPIIRVDDSSGQSGTNSKSNTDPRDSVCEDIANKTIDRIEEDVLNDSQDSRHPMSGQSTPQPMSAKWTPQSDYVNDMCFEPRVQTESELNLMPVPPNITLPQNISVPSHAVPTQAFTKHLDQPLSIDVNQNHIINHMNHKSNELQTTSAILCDVMLSPSQDSNDISTHVSNSHQNYNKASKAMTTPVSTSSEMIMSAPQLQPLPMPTESSVADASNWPLLSQTNHPLHPQIRTTVISERKSPQVIQYSRPYMSPPVPPPSMPRIQPNLPFSMESQMRTPFPSSMSQNVIQRMSGHSPNVSHSPTYQYVPQMNAVYQNPIPRSQPYLQNIGNSGQTGPTYYRSVLRTDLMNRQMHSLRPDANTTSNCPPIPTQDMRLRSNIVSNSQSFGGGLAVGNKPQQMVSHMPSRMPPYPPNTRPISVPMTPLPKDPRNQRPIVYERMAIPMGVERANHLRQRLQKDSQQRVIIPPQYRYSPYPPQTMMFKGPVPHMTSHTAEQTLSAIRPPFTGVEASHKRIPVEGMREKMNAMARHPNPHISECRLIGPTPMLSSYNRQMANNGNHMITKELEVEKILEEMVRNRPNGTPVPMSRSHDFRPILGQQKTNQMNVSMNNNPNNYRITQSSDNTKKILEQLLSKESDIECHPNPVIRNDIFIGNDKNNERQSHIFTPLTESLSTQNETLSTPRPSPLLSPRNGHKDILSEAIELSVVFDDDLEMNENNENETNAETQLTPCADSGPPDEQKTSDENPVYVIYTEENAENMSENDLLELFRSQGLQVIESDSQESQVVETNEDKSEESQPQNDLVIQFDEKSYEEFTKEGSNPLEMQFVVDSDGTQETINLQIIDDTDKGGDIGSGDNISNDKSLVVNENNDKTDDNRESDENIDKEIMKMAEEVIIPNEDSLEMDFMNEKEDNTTKAIEISTNTPTFQSEPTKYVSMPTFRFDAQNGENKTKDSETIESNVEQTEEMEVVDTIEINTEETDDSIETNESDSNVESGVNIEIDVNVVDTNIDLNPKTTESIVETEEISEKVDENEKNDENIVQNNENIEKDLNKNTLKTTIDETNEESMDGSDDYGVDKSEKHLENGLPVTEDMETSVIISICSDSDKDCENDDQNKDQVMESKTNSDQTEHKESDSSHTTIEIKDTSEDEDILMIDESVEPLDVINSTNGVQHPFVSSSVEDSPSTLKPTPIAQQNNSESVLKTTKDKKIDIHLIDSVSDDETSAPTTTTTSPGSVIDRTDITIDCQKKFNKIASKSIKTLNSKKSDNTSANDKCVTDSEVPPIHSQPIDIRSNHSKKSSKSGKKRKSKPEYSSKPPKKTMTAEEERRVLHAIRSRLNGWDKGWTPKEIVGINSLNSCLVFLVRWTNGEQTIVLSDVAKHRCPQLVIKFYESNSVWDEEEDN